MSAFTGLLAAHAPYIPGPSGPNGVALQCHECLNGVGGGEFVNLDEWADHIVAELAKASLRVTTRKPAKTPQPEAMW